MSHNIELQNTFGAEQSNNDYNDIPNIDQYQIGNDLIYYNDELISIFGNIW